jgi:2OG-Fe(II) oxygenase superfamily
LPVEQRIETKEMVTRLRESGELSMLKHGSWEEEMVANCRTKLSVRPHANRAVLFYSQHPNGEPDPLSFHGGCPVLNGTKLAANLWTWSGIRPEFDGAPLKRTFREDEIKAKSSKQLKAVFRNKNKSPEFNDAQLFYDEEGYFGDIGPNSPPISVNTYQGHVWNVKDKITKNTLVTFVVDSALEQEFTI